MNAKGEAAAERPTGRPTIRTQEIVDSILEQIGEGTPLAEVCRQEGMPRLRTVYDWLEKDADLSALFARARKAGYDMIAVDALRIADTPVDGHVEEYEEQEVPDPENAEKTIRKLVLTKRRREDMLQHRKLQVETRLKLLAKWDGSRYGERVQHANDPDNPLPAPQFMVLPVAPKGE